MKKFKKIALTFVALVIAATTLNANPIDSTSKYATEDPFSVKYIGNDGDYLLFQVIVNADKADKKTSFEISDKVEGEIYSSDISSAYKVQTLKIEKRDNQELNFKLVIGKEVYSRSFAILTPITLETK